MNMQFTWRKHDPGGTILLEWYRNEKMADDLGIKDFEIVRPTDKDIEKTP